MNVRVGALLRETVRGSWSRPVWAVATIACAVVVGAACGMLVVADATAIEERTSRLTARGWGIVTVASAAGGAFDARACDLVAEVDGVLGAGAVGTTQEVGAIGLEAGLALTTVSREAVAVLWPGFEYDASAAALLSPGFVALSGAGAGTLYLDSGGGYAPVRTDAIDRAGRYPGLDGGVLLLREDLAEATTCVADVPGEQVERFALDIAASAVSYGVVAVPALSAQDASPTPAQLVQEHRGRGYPLIAGAFLAVVGALRLVRSRRDRAVYRLLDVGRGDLWLMGLIDVVICLGIPVSAAFAVPLLLAERHGVATARLGVLDLGLLLAATAAVEVGYALLFATGRNRHQFAPGA